MRDGNREGGRKEGFSLLEIMIVIAILGTLAALAVSSFMELNEKYRVESETKQFYADIMDIRGRAMQRNRYYFVRIKTNQLGYETYEDSNPAPDGNRSYDAGVDNQVVNVTIKHTMTPVLPGGATNFEFNIHGIASVTGYVRLATSAGSTARPDYDCITIRETRIKMGQYSNGGGGTCVEK